jgi:gliding motility-associated lipoprotein GldD
MIRNIFYTLVLLAMVATFSGCKQTTVPKPAGYFRIDLPEKEYRRLDPGYPYSFEFPVYGVIDSHPGKNAEPYWMNIEFPGYKARIYISYKDVNNNLAKLTEDSHNLAYKHAVKADAIEEKVWTNDSTHVYGILYDVKGNAASAVQFFMTDSTRHYLRGSLYFMSQPNEDSLKPVIDFFREDILHLIETLSWKQ